MPNGNQRGNTTDRHRRKVWLLSPAAGWGGDGIDVPCWTCGVLVEYVDLVADRIIPWCRGGTYRRDNIAPQCALCSHQQGQAITTAICNARRAAEWVASHAYLAAPVG